MKQAPISEVKDDLSNYLRLAEKEEVIGVLKSNREKEEDLVATGILPVILNRQAGSLSYHSALPSDPIRYGYKTFEN